MTLIAIHHVQLAMPKGGEDDARAFYTDLLGLSEVSKPAELAKRGGCWFEAGSVRVHVGVEEDFQPALKAHPAFKVANMNALTVRLEPAEVEMTPDTSIPGIVRCYVADPFGNRIELMSAD